MASGTTYIYPVTPKNVTQAFGANASYYAQFGQKGHNGIDIGATLNQPVVAARDGVVKFAGNGELIYYVSGIAGNYVLIDHGDMWTGYAHNNTLKVKEGQTVRQGQVIALAGQTGTATGVHVHFEFINPANPVTNSNGYWGRVNPNKFIIKESSIMPSEKDVTDYFAYWEKRKPTTAELKDYTGKTWRYLTDKILTSQRGKYAKTEKELKVQVEALKKELAGAGAGAGVSKEVINTITDTNNKVAWIQSLLSKVFK